MVKILDFISFPNSTIRLSNLDLLLQRQSIYIMILPLHMEVPCESRLFVLCGLDMIWFFGFFVVNFNHFDQTFRGWFWGCLDSLDKGWAMSAPHHSRDEVTTGLAKSW